jgi:hypothetical protein
MDRETAHYILDHFSDLLPGPVRLAFHYTKSNFKLDRWGGYNPLVTKTLQDAGWIHAGLDMSDIINDGLDRFEIMVAESILKNNPDKVFFNRCPKCDQLARTPMARQCQHCGYDWHNRVVAQFKFDSAFQISGGYFVLLGDIIAGVVNPGDLIDLTPLGLTCKPVIEEINFARKMRAGLPSEYTGLCTNTLAETEKNVLLSLKDIAKPIDIVSAATSAISKE